MLMTHSWRTEFPILAGISDDVSALLDTGARGINLRSGALVFGPDTPTENLLLLMSGNVRVQRVSQSGQRFTLYRVHAGESCVLTAACLLAFEDCSAEGIAETDVEAILIPRETFDELMTISDEFRAFVFEAYSKRVTDLFMMIEDLAFKRMDIRVARKLLELQDGNAALRATHQRLATELGTTREIISSQLEEFACRGWVTLSRGKIVLHDVAAIGRLAHALMNQGPGDMLTDKPAQHSLLH